MGYILQVKASIGTRGMNFFKLSSLALSFAAISVGTSCNKAPQHSDMQVVELHVNASKGSPHFQLQIPTKFKALPNKENSSVGFEVVYPGMLPFSPDLRWRFYSRHTNWGIDKVRVFVSVDVPIMEGGFAFRNRNDPGQMIYRNRLSNSKIWKQEVPPTPFEQSSIVKKYTAPGFKAYQAIYLIQQEDGRLSAVTCILVDICEGNTTWKGFLAVKYQFRRAHLDDLVDLDSAVLKVVEDFRPQEIGGAD